MRLFRVLFEWDGFRDEAQWDLSIRARREEAERWDRANL